MGGSALKNTYTRRYSAEEFHTLKSEIHTLIDSVFARSYIFESWKNKESFGDLDCLVQLHPNFNIKEFIINTFHPNEIFHNGNCYSFDYKEFQIDFIICSEKYWETSIVYLKYGDLGNFMGRISKAIFGLKYGHDGLSFSLIAETSNQVYETINISTNSQDIFKFLGFDWDVFCKGFDMMEDIFEYVKTSKYFNAKLFDFEELNHINRTRNRKRDGYCKFLEYIKDLPKVEIARPKIIDTLNYIQEGFEISLYEYYYKTLKNIKNKQIARKRVVQIVRDAGYEQKALGEVMSKLNTWINENTIQICNEDVNKLIQTIHQKIQI